MSGGIPDCHNQSRGMQLTSRHIAKHPTAYRQPLTTDSYSAQCY